MDKKIILSIIVFVTILILMFLIVKNNSLDNEQPIEESTTTSNFKKIDENTYELFVPSTRDTEKYVLENQIVIDLKFTKYGDGDLDSGFADLYINNKKIDYHFSYYKSFEIKTFGNYIVIDTYSSDIRGSHLLLIDKFGVIINDLYELENQMIWRDYEIINNQLILTANRATHGPTILLPNQGLTKECYGNEEINLSDVLNQYSLSKDYPISAKYIYKLQSDGSISDKPIIEVTETLEQAYNDMFKNYGKVCYGYGF